jgi:hypothetical protein
MFHRKQCERGPLVRFYGLRTTGESWGLFRPSAAVAAAFSLDTVDHLGLTNITYSSGLIRNLGEPNEKAIPFLFWVHPD